MDRKNKLVQRLLCGTLCFLKLRHQTLDRSGFVNKNTGRFPSHSIIPSNQQPARNNSKLLPPHRRSTTPARNNIHALRQSGKTQALTCAST
jgi:hypothetical protein